jgi:hypothetical protein
MSKSNGLGSKFLVGGYDLSGDVQALDSIGGGPALGDFTDITMSAHARQGLLRDGKMSFTSFMDPANAHPVLGALPTADEQMMALLPPLAMSSANTAACLVAKQVSYDPNRAADGMLLNKTDGEGNGFGLEWCMPLTAGLRTDTTGTTGTGLDCGNSFSTPLVPASTTPVTNTSPLPATVVISGGTLTFVFVNGVQAGTADGTYTVPSGQTISITYSVAPTWTWTLQTAFGAQAYLQVTAFTGSSVTVAVQDSADGVTYAAVTGLTFTAVTAAPNTQRLATAGNATIRRYLRIVTTGTFTNAVFAVALNRNLVATAF